MANKEIKNLQALVLGQGFFAFSPGATSLADAQARGYQDFGNIVAVGFKPEVEVIEHEGTYETGKRVDRRLATKGLHSYGLKCDEFTRENLKIALGGTDLPAITQSALTAATGDTWAFGTTAGVANRWYDITVSGVRIREVTGVFIQKAAPAACTVDAGTDVITAAGHGMVAGQQVRFAGTAVPTGLTAGTIYFTRDVTTNTFKVAATASGAAIDLTSAGTAVTFEPGLVDGTDFVLHGKMGRVRFLTDQSANKTPLITASAIVEGDDASLLGLTPLQELVKSGWGRLAIFEPSSANKLVYDHVDFSCDVSFESGADLDGKSVGTMDFKVLVTENVGKVYSAE